MTQARKLRRFFSENPLPETGERVFLSVKETQHLRQIIRLKPGDSCLVLDGQGKEAEALIEGFLADGKTALRIQKRSLTVTPSNLYLRIFQSLPQKGKMDTLIEKAQELGVQEIYPLETERTIVRMKAEGEKRAMDRWNKLAQEAAKQSGSRELIKIHETVDFQKAAGLLDKTQTTLLFHPDDDAVLFSTWIKRAGMPAVLNIFIGPEGGFSDDEAAKLAEKGARKISLGETLLKVDTAFIGIVSTLRFLYS